MLNYVTADEAVKLINPGERVFIHSTSVPQTLVNAMCRRSEELKGTYIYSAFILGDAVWGRPEHRENFIINSFFIGSFPPRRTYLLRSWPPTQAGSHSGWRCGRI